MRSPLTVTDLTHAQVELRQATARMVGRHRWALARQHEAWFGIHSLPRDTWMGARCVDCGTPLDGYPEDAVLCLTHARN